MASIPNTSYTPPANKMWIRDVFGGNVSWDPNTGNITTPIGTLTTSDYTDVGGKAYVSPEALAGLVLSKKPTPLTQDTFNQYTNIMKQMYQPLYDERAAALQRSLDRISANAQTERDMANAAYGQAQANLQRSERDTWNRMMKSLGTRGIDSSGLASYEQRKVGETYAPEYQQLAAKQAATLSGISRDAALGMEDLAGQYKSLEQNYLSQLMQGALNQYNTQQNLEMQNNRDLANLLMNIGARNDQRQQQAFQNAIAEAQLTGKYVAPELRQILSDIVNAKANYGPLMNAGQTQQAQLMAQRARNLYQLLPQYGIDPNQVNQNVTIAQMAKNLGQANIGVDTLAKRQQDFAQNVEFPWNKYLQGEELKLAQNRDKREQQQMDWQHNVQWPSEFGLDKWYKQQQVGLQNKQLGLESDKWNYEKSQQDAKNNLNEQTRKALTDYARFTNRQDALNHFINQQDAYIANGVDPAVIYNWITKMFPAQTGTSSGSVAGVLGQ